MLRLLQGDVGAGKTIVALLAMANAIEAGAQAAMMAPTEILARQHFASIAAACGSRRPAHRDPDRPRKGQGARRPPRGPRRSGAIDIRRRHPCAVPGKRRVPRSRPRRGRRAAPLRRPSAAAALGQGQQVRHAGDDRDADPAHPGSDRLWRHGHLDPRHQAARPPADQDGRGSPRQRSTRSSERARNAVAAGQKIYWICPLVEENEEVEATSAEERFRALSRALRTCPSAWCMAA